MAWPTSSVVLFDVLGTLVHDPFHSELPRFFGLTLDELIAEKHPTTWLEFETGAIDEAAAVARMFRDGRPVDIDALKACLRGAYRWLDGMAELLAELARAGTTLHLMSNYPCWYRLIEEELGLSRFAPWSFVSCQTGVRKPSAKAFERVIATLGVPAGELLLVDDQPPNCEGARRAGLEAILFAGATPLRAELAARGLL